MSTRTVCPVILRGWRLNCVPHAKLSPALRGRVLGVLAPAGHGSVCAQDCARAACVTVCSRYVDSRGYACVSAVGGMFSN